MSFSVGILYSTQEFLEFAAINQIAAKGMVATKTKFGISPSDAVFDVSQENKWILVDANGFVQLTESGEMIRRGATALERLRLQLPYLISTYKPTWANRLQYGREPAKSAMPSNVEQCFEEAGLFEDWNNELIQYWSELGKESRARLSHTLGNIGLQAEAWSREYEQFRTRNTPLWKSLDTSFAGYDILSVRSRRNRNVLRIEVKGSLLAPKQAIFNVTENEWETASRSGNYFFHLWLVASPPRLFVVSYRDVRLHISKNRGDGKWKNIAIPYRPFLVKERKLTPLRKQLAAQKVFVT